MKNIIFSDVDGTIYGRDHKLNPQTIKDINFAQGLDVEFVIATGNGFFENMDALADKLNTRYVITSNGASIYDRDIKDFIFKSKLEISKANELLKFANENKIATIFWDEEGVFVNECTPESTREIVKNAMVSSREIKEISTVESEIFKIEFYDVPEKIELINEFAKALDLQLARMKPNHLEVTNLNVSKGEAIKVLAKQLEVDLSKTMGIGDSANDISMFEVVNSSYAMDNSSDEVKSITKYYTSDVSQNGLGEAIIDYLHREKLDRT